MRQPTATNLFERLTVIDRRLDRYYRLRAKDHQLLVAVLRAQNLLTELQVIEMEMETDQMATIKEVLDELEKGVASAEANTETTQSIALAVDAMKTAQATLIADFEAYKASHPADEELNVIFDKAKALVAAIDADTVAERALANTPADPNA